eukprot:667655-Rhodomonas_salina.1
MARTHKSKFKEEHPLGELRCLKLLWALSEWSCDPPPISFGFALLLLLLLLPAFWHGWRLF